MNYILGDDRNQMTMLTPILDDYVAEDNPPRVIDAFVNSFDVSALGFATSNLADTGGPPYSPYDLLKLYIRLLQESTLQS